MLLRSTSHTPHGQSILLPWRHRQCWTRDFSVVVVVATCRRRWFLAVYFVRPVRIYGDHVYLFYYHFGSHNAAHLYNNIILIIIVIISETMVQCARRFLYFSIFFFVLFFFLSLFTRCLYCDLGGQQQQQQNKIECEACKRATERMT